MGRYRLHRLHPEVDKTLAVLAHKGSYGGIRADELLCKYKFDSARTDEAKRQMFNTVK